MRYLLILISLLAITVIYAQTDVEQLNREVENLRKENELLKMDNAAWKAENEEYQDRLERLNNEYLILKEKDSFVSYELSLKKMEIETMKKIMRGYIFQIDELNTQLKACEEEK